MITILDQRQHNVIAGEARHELDGMAPWYIRVLYALQDMHRAACFDQPTEQKMFAAFFNQSAGDRIGLFTIR